MRGWACIIITCAAALLFAGSARGVEPGLAVKDGRFHLNGKPYRGVGANYYDLLTRIDAKPSDESSLEGLRKLGAAGVPFVRFNGGGFSKADWTRYLKNKEAHFAAFDRVVKTAEEAGVGLIPALFWTTQLHRVADERKEAWGDPNSRTIALMRDYVREVVTRYKDSPALWAWELGNEWNLNADLPNAAHFRQPGDDERDDFKSQHMAVVVREFAAAVRAIDTHRPIMSGNSHPRASSWHNTTERSWKPDSKEQWREVILRENTEALDTIGIHIYADNDASECGKWAATWGDYLGTLRALASEKKLALYVGEFGLADGGKRGNEEVKTRYREILQALGASQIDLAAVWVFDLPQQNNAWSITFNNSRAYMLQDVIEANKRWNASVR